MLTSNPFSEYAITEYNQYKKLPFLESDSIIKINNAINGQIRDNFMFPERFLILGVRGLGKTSCLFHVRDLLKESKKRVNIITFSRLITSNEDIEKEAKTDMNSIIKNTTYILIDFPDKPKKQQFEEFLDFVWNTITHPKLSTINFVFSLNVNHYDFSLSLSEVLGKFDKGRLDSMSREETERLIKLRLKMVDSEEFFEKEVYDLIYRYSKGIPRNIVCACRDLADNFFSRDHVTYEEASKVLREDFVQQIINDRVEDINDRLLYKKIMEIINSRFNGSVERQEDLIDLIKKDTGVGRNKAMKNVENLKIFGLLNITKGGKNNTQKIISLL